jgi:hypothetical protein
MHGNLKLRPWEVDRLTTEEIQMCLAEDLEKPYGGVVLRSPEEVQQYGEWRRSLSWEEKIDIARDG